jgi:hypothetical protein
MTLEKHQELVNTIQNLGMRTIGAIDPDDKELLAKALRHLIEYQILISKELK